MSLVLIWFCNALTRLGGQKDCVFADKMLCKKIWKSNIVEERPQTLQRAFELFSKILEILR